MAHCLNLKVVYLWGPFVDKESLGATGRACEVRLGTHQLPEEQIKRLPYLVCGFVHLFRLPET